MSVYCGRCRASYTPDRDWVTRYFAAAKQELERQIAKGYASEGDRAALAAERAKILAAIRTPRPRAVEPEQPAPSTNPAT